MMKYKVPRSKWILPFAFVFLAGPLGLCAGQPGKDFVRPEVKPPNLGFQTVNRTDPARGPILVPTTEASGRVTTVTVLPSAKIAVADLLAKRWGGTVQNKYLKSGMWISIPVDPRYPDTGKRTLKMLFTNIDIYVDGGAGNRRLPFDILDPLVLDSYKTRNLRVPDPVVVRLDATRMEAYAKEVKGTYLDRYLRADPAYVEVPGLYYLVPRQTMDWEAIKAEVARAGNPRSFEDYVIDGTLFGTWYPVEHLERTGEATVTREGPGLYVFRIYRWPSDDRSHVGF